MSLLNDISANSILLGILTAVNCLTNNICCCYFQTVKLCLANLLTPTHHRKHICQLLLAFFSRRLLIEHPLLIAAAQFCSAPDLKCHTVTGAAQRSPSQLCREILLRHKIEKSVRAFCSGPHPRCKCHGSKAQLWINPVLFLAVLEQLLLLERYGGLCAGNHLIVSSRHHVIM